MSFVNKVVLITGGNTGIGAATAELFAKKGAKVGVVGRNESELAAVTQRCSRFGSNTIAIKTDYTDEDEADLIVDKIIDKFGKLDVLVNNAAIFRVAGILSKDFMKTYDEVMNVNIRGPVSIIHVAVPHLIKTKGNIVNVSCTCTAKPNVVYKISKGALNYFTKSVALELAPHGVRVNSVSPCPVRTDIFKGLKVNESTLKEMRAMHRVSEIKEIADAIVFVASHKAKNITGTDYILDNMVLC